MMRRIQLYKHALLDTHRHGASFGLCVMIFITLLMLVSASLGIFHQFFFVESHIRAHWWWRRWFIRRFLFGNDASLNSGGSVTSCCVSSYSMVILGAWSTLRLQYLLPVLSTGGRNHP